MNKYEKSQRKMMKDDRRNDEIKHENQETKDRKNL